MIENEYLNPIVKQALKEQKTVEYDGGNEILIRLNPETLCHDFMIELNEVQIVSKSQVMQLITPEFMAKALENLLHMDKEKIKQYHTALYKEKVEARMADENYDEDEEDEDFFIDDDIEEAVECEDFFGGGVLDEMVDNLLTNISSNTTLLKAENNVVPFEFDTDITLRSFTRTSQNDDLGVFTARCLCEEILTEEKKLTIVENGRETLVAILEILETVTVKDFHCYELKLVTVG